MARKRPRQPIHRDDLVVVLVRPKNAGNIGAVARLMKNFGLRRLWLISPATDHLSKEAIDRSSKASEILRHARVCTWREVESLDVKVGTSSQVGSDYNLTRTPLSPRALAERLSKVQGAAVGLIFGPEDSGLSNAELEVADMLVTIPSRPDFPVLNLSHAIAILLYELAAYPDALARFVPISAAEKSQLAKMVDCAVKALHLPPAKALTQRRLWARLVGKSLLSRREAYALMGFFSQVQHRLDQAAAASPARAAHQRAARRTRKPSSPQT